MKPPADDTPFHYDNAQWDKIKESLAGIGVDADTATVGKKQYPMRAELERLAQQYRDHASARVPTVQQFINEATDNAKKIAAVRDLFAPKLWPVAWTIGNKPAAEIYAQLTAAETKLQEAVKQAMIGAYQHDFSYEGGRHNAAKPALHSYVCRLSKVWDKLAGESNAPRRRNIFVLNCAAPVIPQITKRIVRDVLGKTTKTTI